MRKAFQPSPWDNLPLSQLQLSDLAAAFKITHVQSGRYFIGSTGNCYNYFHTLAAFLRQDVSKIHSLQLLYRQDPHFTVQLQHVGVGRSLQERRLNRDLALEKARQWLDELHSEPLCVNALYMSRRTKHRKEPDAEQPPKPQPPRKKISTVFGGLIPMGSLFPV